MVKDEWSAGSKREKNDPVGLALSINALKSRAVLALSGVAILKNSGAAGILLLVVCRYADNPGYAVVGTVFSTCVLPPE